MHPLIRGKHNILERSLIYGKANKKTSQYSNQNNQLSMVHQPLVCARFKKLVNFLLNSKTHKQPNKI